jgi:hypothetical protein
MLRRPPLCAGRPDLRRAARMVSQCLSSAEDLMDALSDVLRAVRLSGAVFFDVDASAPWVAQSPPGDAIVGRVFPGADHLMSYHVVAGRAGEG